MVKIASTSRAPMVFIPLLLRHRDIAPKATANLPPQPEVGNRDVCSLGELAMYPDVDVCPLSTTRSGKMLEGVKREMSLLCAVGRSPLSARI